MSTISETDEQLKKIIELPIGRNEFCQSVLNGYLIFQ